MKITLEDHSDEVLAALESACTIALETCGLVGGRERCLKRCRMLKEHRVYRAMRRCVDKIARWKLLGAISGSTL